MPEFKLHEAFVDPGAEEYKNKGNAAFKEQNWDEAVKNYNKAISLDPNVASYYSNRAACWSSKGNHEGALRDANKCLELDASFIKGYSRKGKALFDLGRLDEAEAAYKEGLGLDATNAACVGGIASVKEARKAKKASQGMGASFGKASSMFEQATKKLKSGGLGGRMQMYMVALAGYVIYTQFMKRGGKGSAGQSMSMHETAEAADDDTAYGDGPQADVKLSWKRGFSEVAGNWIGYLEVAPETSKEDMQLLLMHRTASSAAAEFGSVVETLLSNAPAGVKLLAPDRPCHGLSPCPANRVEPRDIAGWAGALLSKKRSARRLAIMASGREAGRAALALARRRRDAVRLLLFSPGAAAPPKPSGDASSASAMLTWLSSQPAATARQVVDAGVWAAARQGFSSDAEQGPEDEDDEEPLVGKPGLRDGGKLAEGAKVTLLYTEQDTQDDALRTSLEDLGAEVTIRQIRSDSSAELAVELRRLLRSDKDDEEEVSTQEED